MAVAKSPKYPNFSLAQAVKQIEKVFKADRRNPIDRAVAAKHMGYGGLSGAADKSLGTMVQYGLFERVGKGEIRVTQLAVDILHPDSERQRLEALAKAAFNPPLFKALKERFPDGVSDEALRSYLVRENFFDRAINPIISAFSQTCAFLKQEGAFESGGDRDSSDPESDLPDDEEVVYGGARVGDLIQWESQGALQFEQPKRVRLVSDDGQWVVVEDSETGIPMSEVLVESQAAPPPPVRQPPPTFALPREERKANIGEDWLQASVGASTKVVISVSGKMGPKQIGKLIKLLEAQQAVLEDDEDEGEDYGGCDRMGV